MSKEWEGEMGAGGGVGMDECGKEFKATNFSGDVLIEEVTGSSNGWVGAGRV